MIREKKVIREFVTSYEMRDYIDIPLHFEISSLSFADSNKYADHLPPSIPRLRYRYYKTERLIEGQVITRRWFVYKYSGVVI